MTRDSQYSVYVERVGWSDSNKVWLVRRDARGTYNCTIEKGCIEETLITENGIDQPCFFQLPIWVTQDIIDALVEKLPPTKKEAVDAELKATIRHLEDMRDLVFTSRVINMKEIKK
jgi:hypothetical protein